MTPGQHVRVAVVGAGFGGLGVALKLRAAGYDDFVVLDKADEVGGTWQANTYPGVACDAPSHVYSYSFVPGRWSRRFAPGAEIADYLAGCARSADLGSRLRLGVEVRSGAWDGAAWRLELSDGSVLVAEVLVSATGQLSVPSVPAIPGLDRFAGPAFHTARWRHDVPLDGRRVGVVGTGASAIQVVPAIADRVAALTVFQRSAPHVFPKPDGPYRGPGVPVVRRAARRAMWLGFELFGLFFWRWPRLMWLLDRHHARSLAKAVPDPGLRAALTPSDRPGCKRALVSSEYHPTFTRPHVHLETAAIAEVDETGVLTASGVHHDLDVLVLATGFDTSPTRPVLELTGVGGRTLREAWAAGASAYRGVSVPGFPNLFLVYGPNTNLGSGSITYMLEAQADHVVAALRVLDGAPGRHLEVRAAAHDAFVAGLAPRLRHSVWASGCTSWYLDERGRDTHNWPGSMRSYRRLVERVDLDDYALTP